MKGYDYAQEGLYFITLVVKNRLHLFGQIENGVMLLNDAGLMVEKWYYELESKYPDKRCHEMVVMPNHFHCIIENMRWGGPVWPPQPGSPESGDSGGGDSGGGDSGGHAGPPQRPPKSGGRYGMHNKICGATIGDAMDWFKTMTTNEYIRGVKNLGWTCFEEKLWQRNYWENIIRSEQALDNITRYINENPKRWDDDLFSKKE